MSVVATVIVPTHDHGPTLRLAVASARMQTVEEIEIFIVGDGAPDVTREIVREFMAEDGRVHFFDHPKGPRHGEIYRHEALQQAAGEIVCYLSDDDLWFPEHVEAMRNLLEENDFVHALPLHATVDGEVASIAVDFAAPGFRARMLSGTSFIPLSCGAHTLAIYRRLPEGWSTTPPGIFTDLFMWQKFLRLPDCRAASGTRPTLLLLPSPGRRNSTLDERVDELERWARKIADRSWREGFIAEVLDATVRSRAQIAAEFAARADTRTWRLRQWVLNTPLLGSAARALAARSGRRAVER